MAAVNTMTAAMRPGDRFGLVAFGADAALERRPAGRPGSADITSVVSGSGTNIEAALRVARLALPADGGRIVLVSDGRETTGAAAREAARAAASRIRVDVLPAGDTTGAQGQLPHIAGVFAPPEVHVGEPFLVSVEAEGASATRGRILLYRDASPPLARDIVFGPDDTARASFSEQRLQAGVYSYRASMDGESGDASPGESAGAAVTVAGEPAVLYITPGQGAVAALLARSGFRVSRIDARSAPPAAAGLSPFTAVVLDGVESDTLDERQTSALARYVDQGGGLLVLGGPATLNLDGYPTGPLGNVLPVDLRPRAGQRAPGVAFVLVFDKSGSMADRTGGVPKIEMARQAVMRVLEKIPPTDAFGAIAFDAAPVVVAQPGTVPDPLAIENRLRGIEPGGSTSISPAVDMALGWLRSARAERRHLLLISDGRTTPADAARLRAALTGQRIELSVVAIGADADRAFFQRLARDTGGRAYFPEDVRQLPIIAAREAVRSTGGRVVQESFVVRATPHPMLAGLDLTTLPRMGGYVVTAARPGADAILKSHLDDPVLCAWRAGLGRVAVFTGDLPSAWSAPLRGWKGFNPLWSRTARWLGRPAGSGRWHATLDDTENGARLVVEADEPDGGFAGVADVRATIRRPDGGTQDIVLRATAPGRYEGSLEASVVGLYVASIVAREGRDAPEERVLRGFYRPASRERRFAGVDMPGLRRLADITGGESLAARDNPFDRARPAEYREAWPLMATLAMGVFLVEVALRDRSVVAWWRNRWRRRAGGQPPRGLTV
jgi:Mg-chelatase subunit ChlD